MSAERCEHTGCEFMQRAEYCRVDTAALHERTLSNLGILRDIIQNDALEPSIEKEELDKDDMLERTKVFEYIQQGSGALWLSSFCVRQLVRLGDGRESYALATSWGTKHSGTPAQEFILVHSLDGTSRAYYMVAGLPSTKRTMTGYDHDLLEKMALRISENPIALSL